MNNRYSEIGECKVCGTEYLRTGSRFRGCCSKECYTQWKRQSDRIYRDNHRGELIFKNRVYYEKNHDRRIHYGRDRYYSNHDRIVQDKRGYIQNEGLLEITNYGIRQLFKTKGHHINLLCIDNRLENIYYFKDREEHMSVIHRFINDNYPDLNNRAKLFIDGLLYYINVDKRYLIPTAPPRSKERSRQYQRLREFCLDYLEKFKFEHPHDVDVNPQNYLPHE